MSETYFENAWSMLRNPFQSSAEALEVITSHVSGRRTDIREIVTEEQSAIILAGAPRIGKTSLIRYLRRPPTAEWSWRNELKELREPYKLDDMQFAQIDLTSLEGIENDDELVRAFITQCTAALQSVWRDRETAFTDLKGLRDLLRQMTREHPH